MNPCLQPCPAPFRSTAPPPSTPRRAPVPPALLDTVEELAGRPLERFPHRRRRRGNGHRDPPAARPRSPGHRRRTRPRHGGRARRSLPSVPVVRGDGNRLPLATGSADLITYAQSWHWTDPARALPEALRVLRPGGTLALWWNVSDYSVPWVVDQGERLRRHFGVGRRDPRPRVGRSRNLARPRGRRLPRRLLPGPGPCRSTRTSPTSPATPPSSCSAPPVRRPRRFIDEERSRSAAVFPDGMVEERYVVELGCAGPLNPPARHEPHPLTGRFVGTNIHHMMNSTTSVDTNDRRGRGPHRRPRTPNRPARPRLHHRAGPDHRSTRTVGCGKSTLMRAVSVPRPRPRERSTSSAVRPGTRPFAPASATSPRPPRSTTDLTVRQNLDYFAAVLRPGHRHRAAREDTSPAPSATWISPPAPTRSRASSPAGSSAACPSRSPCSAPPTPGPRRTHRGPRPRTPPRPVEPLPLPRRRPRHHRPRLLARHGRGRTLPPAPADARRRAPRRRHPRRPAHPHGHRNRRGGLPPPGRQGQSPPTPPRTPTR